MSRISAMAQIGFLELQTAALGTQPLFLELELRRSQGIILQVSGKPFEVHVAPTISSQLTVEGFGIRARLRNAAHSSWLFRVISVDFPMSAICPVTGNSDGPKSSPEHVPWQPQRYLGNIGDNISTRNITA
jgi:hypothetical protein